MKSPTVINLNADLPHAQTGRERLLRRMFSNPTTIVGLILVTIAIGCALFAPVIAPYDPMDGDLKNLYVMPPSPQHLFGTDAVGQDILSRVIYGARISLKIALIAQTIGIVLGVTVGLVTGYFGGWLDLIMMRLVD